MITVVGGIKGGGGKTTLATNLAVMRAAANKKVLLVDADEQRSASDWASQREAMGIKTEWTTIQLAGKSIHAELKKLASNYDDIIVDVGGRDTTSQRSALAIAHVCLVPFRPKSFDMWTLGQVKAMISEIKAINPGLQVFAIINQADSRGSDNEDAVEMIKEFEDFVCLGISLGNRKAFANAAAEGLGVVELKKGDPKAVEEMKSLYSHIYCVCNACPTSIR
jgi:chromosome partitioning protein